MLDNKRTTFLFYFIWDIINLEVEIRDSYAIILCFFVSGSTNGDSVKRLVFQLTENLADALYYL